MVLSARRGALLIFPVAALLWTPLVPAQGKDVEQRDYTVLVDGKESGQSRIQIVVQDDGTTDVTGSVSVTVNTVLKKFTTVIDSNERWKDGRVVSLRTTSTENGKKTEVQAAVQGDQLVVRVNGKDKNARADAWTSSYWKLADARYHNKAVPVLETDTGKEQVGELKYVGAEKLPISGQQTECYHFKVTGVSSPIDLWYDRYHRLVRQEFTEAGHRVIVNLTSVKR